MEREIIEWSGGQEGVCCATRTNSYFFVVKKRGYSEGLGASHAESCVICISNFAF